MLTLLLLQTANQNSILGYVPESVGLLLFGVGLIGVTIALRWLFKKGEGVGGKGQ